MTALLVLGAFMLGAVAGAAFVSWGVGLALRRLQDSGELAYRPERRR